jgi:hypothetical protein
MWLLSCPFGVSAITLSGTERYTEFDMNMHATRIMGESSDKPMRHDEKWSARMPRKGLRTGGQGLRVSQLGEQGQKRIHSTRGQRVLAVLASSLQMLV